MFDSQIVALCREHGIDTVLTNDRDFELFEAVDNSPTQSTRKSRLPDSSRTRSVPGWRRRAKPGSRSGCGWRP